jgi:cysteine desulfurase/selenocysteine lyase
VKYQHDFPAIFANPQRHFFDNAATTQACQVAIDTKHSLDSQFRTNIARGVYQEAEKISEAYEEARQTIAELIGAKNNEIVFCRGTTDALNISARCIIENLSPEKGVLISDAEHHSNFLPWLELCKKHNIPLYRLPVNTDGAIDFAQLTNFDNNNIGIVAITHCSNVTGIISDIELVSKWCKKNQALLVLDGAQMMQHSIPNMRELGADVYCFSGHKAFATSGIGVLYAKEQLLESWQPVTWGGGMILKLPPVNNNPLLLQEEENLWAPAPQKFEAGSPPYEQAIILSKALKWLADLEQEPLKKHHQALFNKAYEIMNCYDFIDNIGNVKESRNPIFSFNIKSIHPHDAAQLFDSLGFCLRAGHHCAKPLLHSLGIDACLRMSLSCYNTLEELELFEHALQKIYQQAKSWQK